MLIMECGACGRRLKAEFIESIEDELGRPLGTFVCVEGHECDPDEDDEE